MKWFGEQMQEHVMKWTQRTAGAVMITINVGVTQHSLGGLYLNITLALGLT